MQTEDSQKVVRRFFEALYRLKDDGKIRGKQTFTREFDINRWNLTVSYTHLTLPTNSLV